MKIIAIIGKNHYFISALLKMFKLLELNYKISFEEDIKEDNYYDYIIINSNSCKFKNRNIELSSKYCFINMDNNTNENVRVFANLITYGFGSKNTVTVSSIENDNQKLVYCLQRSLNYNAIKMIEPEEMLVNIEFKNDQEIYAIMIAITINLIEKGTNNKLQTIIQ